MVMSVILPYIVSGAHLISQQVSHRILDFCLSSYFDICVNGISTIGSVFLKKVCLKFCDDFNLFLWVCF